jgi:hypothetical protein
MPILQKPGHQNPENLFTISLPCFLVDQSNAMPGNDRCKCHLMSSDLLHYPQYTDVGRVFSSKWSVLSETGWKETMSSDGLPSLFSASLRAGVRAVEEDAPQKDQSIVDKQTKKRCVALTTRREE